MPKMRRITSVAVAMLCTGAPSIAFAANPHRPIPRLNWAPCGPDHPLAECAVARVPLDYDRPHGATIEVALARLPAPDARQRLGSVFLNPGGPGGSGVDFVLMNGAALAAVFQGRFDVIGFDPRGVARSTPIHCFTTNDESAAFFAGAPYFPYQRDQQRPFFELYSSYTQQCLDQGLAITAHMSTADVARDLDVLRAAVGDEKLTYVGFSYGTHLGSTYANLFPNHLRAMVLDGVLDPRSWSAGRVAYDSSPASEAEFEEFLRLCDEAGPQCALTGSGGARARFDALAEAVKAHPFQLPGGPLVTYDLVMAVALEALYAPERWGGPSGYGALLGAVADAVLGVPGAALTAQRVRHELQLAIDAAAPSLTAYDNTSDAHYGTMCADAEYPRPFRAFAATGERLAEASAFGPLWWWSEAPCARWPAANDRYAGPWSATTSAPVLLVSNLFDGVTSYGGGVALNQLLPNSRLLTYAGWGHTALARSQCALAFVSQYLLDGSLPPEGTVCPASPNPFVAEATTASLRSSQPEFPPVGLPPRSRPRWP